MVGESEYKKQLELRRQFLGQQRKQVEAIQPKITQAHLRQRKLPALQAFVQRRKEIQRIRQVKEQARMTLKKEFVKQEQYEKAFKDYQQRARAREAQARHAFAVSVYAGKPLTSAAERDVWAKLPKAVKAKALAVAQKYESRPVDKDAKLGTVQYPLKELFGPVYENDIKIANIFYKGYKGYEEPKGRR